MSENKETKIQWYGENGNRFLYSQKRTRDYLYFGLRVWRVRLGVAKRVKTPITPATETPAEG
jgi:hypothetical protein